MGEHRPTTNGPFQGQWQTGWFAVQDCLNAVYDDAEYRDRCEDHWANIFRGSQ